MTLAELRSKCLNEVQDFTKTKLIPDKDGVIRGLVAELCRGVGGIKTTTTFNTVAGTRQYGISAGFPSDFFKAHSCFRTSDRTRIEIIDFKDRDESGSGLPTGYYIYGREIGFDATPSSAIEIEFNYYGLLNNFTADGDTVMAVWPQQRDDDSLWDAVVFGFAEIYNRRKRDLTAMKMYLDLKNKAIFKIRRDFDLMNADEAPDVELPDYYFDKEFSLERFGNEGDTFIIS